MTVILPALLVSLGVTLAVVPVVAWLARRWGVVDAPDARRKLHGRIVPLGGGVAVFAGWGTALAGLTLFTDAGAGPGGAPRFYGLAVGCGLLALVGLYDDWKELRGRQKLLGQALAVSVLIASGTLVSRLSVFGVPVDLGLLAVPFTAFWLLGAINAVNLLDGIDGLASTVGVILGTAFCAMALVSPGGSPVAAVAAALVGGLLAFLFYNFPPAKIFLGDAGSMLIGLVLGFVAVHSNFKEAATMALTAPVAVWAVPIFDVLMAILRRRLTGRSIYTTDRGHLHHRLTTELNLSIPRVLLLVAALCSVTAAGAVASVLYRNEWIAIGSASAVLAAMVATRTFGSQECGLLLRRTGGAAKSLVPGKGPELVGDGWQRVSQMWGEHEWGELWDRLLRETKVFGLRSVHLDVNHPALREDFSARWTSAAPVGDAQRVMRADLPLVSAHGPVGWMRITADHSGSRAADRIAHLMDTLTGFEKELVDLLETELPAKRERMQAVERAAAENRLFAKRPGPVGRPAVGA